jgi:hypothetical protein
VTGACACAVIVVLLRLPPELLNMRQGREQSILHGILSVCNVAQMTQRDSAKACRVLGNNIGRFLNFALITLDYNWFWIQL